MLFSIWEEATKNEVEKNEQKTKENIFGLFNYEEEEANKEEIFLGF